MYRIKIENPKGSELNKRGFKYSMMHHEFTNKKKATNFAEELEKAGFKVVDIIKE